MHAAILRYFVAVAEDGSIRRASERLHISPSAVNRQILNLESALKAQLFERRPDGMRLTDAGKMVLRHSRETLRGFECMRGEIDRLRGVLSGRVTIACLDSLTIQVLPESLFTFIEQHSAVQIRAIVGDPMAILRSVAQGNADLGLTFAPFGRSGVRVLEEIPCAMYAIMKPDHDLAGHSSLTLDECSRYPLIYQDNSGYMEMFFGDAMDKFRDSHRAVVVSNSIALLKRLLLRGAGIAFYTRLGFAEEIAEGRLAAVPLQGRRLSALRLTLIALSDRSLPAAAETLAEHLRHTLAQFADSLEAKGKPGPARTSGSRELKTAGIGIGPC